MIAPGAAVLRHAEIDSTNSEAIRRAEAGEGGPLWIVADAQTAGRGRRGRRWAGLPGNLFCTYLGAASAAPERVALLGIAAAVAVAEVVEGFAPEAGVRLKWPNDVLVGDAKIAGVLLETGLSHGRRWFALGIGLNVAAAPRDLGYPATALAALGARADRCAAFAALRAALADQAQALAEPGGFEPIRRAWRRRGPPVGAPLSVHAGARAIAGGFLDLAEDGALLLTDAAGLPVRVVSGEVSAAPSPLLEA